ncbi:MAG: hypothetical protein IPL49_05530 [Saprospirales bacterium]|nr:hypothetical protein [Saprospirales bacterium]MBK8490369.1 hypothetical protein [Saprospirales bacterium]
MRDNYFLVMFFLGIALLIICGFFLDDFILDLCGGVLHYWLAQKWLLSREAMLLEGVVGVGLLAFLIMVFLRGRYNPQGYSPSGTHIWVFQDTGRKFKDASECEMYEREHGPGSWTKKVEAEKKAFAYIGGAAAAVAMVGLYFFSNVQSGALLFWALLTGIASYVLFSFLGWLIGVIRDEFEYEETLRADLLIAFNACLILVAIFLLVYFLYFLVFLFLPAPSAVLKSIYLGAHGVFAIYLIGLLVLWPFMPVMAAVKGYR